MQKCASGGASSDTFSSEARADTYKGETMRAFFPFLRHVLPCTIPPLSPHEEMDQLCGVVLAPVSHYDCIIIIWRLGGGRLRGP